MKKFVSIIVVCVICISMLTGCASELFTKKMEVKVNTTKCITSVAFDTDDDYKWYVENVWRNDELSDVEKDNIYFEMTGNSIYPEG